MAKKKGPKTKKKEKSLIERILDLGIEKFMGGAEVETGSGNRNQRKQIQKIDKES